MPHAGPVMNVPCSTTLSPCSTRITSLPLRSGALGAEAGGNAAVVFHLARRLVREREADRLTDLLVQMRDQSRSAGQDRHALERLHRETGAEQHCRNRTG